MSKVLVTGGSGFIGSHVILQLLAAGREVRTTVRNLNAQNYEDIAMRDLINAGLMVGPRMFVSGYGLSLTPAPQRPGAPVPPLRALLCSCHPP